MLQARKLRLAALLSGIVLAGPAPAATLAVVANYHDDAAALVDTGCRPTFPNPCNPLLAVLPVGSHPYAVAMHPDGSRAYVTNSWDDSVSVIDVPGRRVVATVPVGSLPYGVAVDGHSGRVYVAGLANHTVTVIDRNNVVLATIALPNPHGLALSPDGARLYVGDYGAGALTVVDTATRTVLGQVAVGGLPVGIAVHPSGARVYVAAFAANALVAVDAATRTVVGQAAVGAGAAGVALSPNGDTAFVANMNDNSVSIVRTADMAVLATVPVGSQPVGVAAAPGGQAVFVANSADGTLTTIDTATRAAVSTVHVGDGPFSPGAFVADELQPRAALLDLAATLAAQQLPNGLYTPWSNFLRQSLAAYDAGAMASSCERLARFTDAVRQAQATQRVAAATAALLLGDAATTASALHCAP
jgi:YVTN family beta-propeller protein